MNYIVLDFETTGLDHRTEQIIEVALIKYDEDFNEILSFSSLVQLQEGKELPVFITELTGITEGDLEEGITVEALRDWLNLLIDPDDVLVAQYAPFDLAFLKQLTGYEPWTYICTKSLTAQVEPYESSSLKPTCERLGIPLEGEHRAFNDVKATAELLQYRIKEDKCEFTVNTIVKSPDRELTFIPEHTEYVLDKGDFMSYEQI